MVEQIKKSQSEREEDFKQIGYATNRAFTGLWTRNLVANEYSIRKGKGVVELVGLCNSVSPILPVILVATGPSLDKNIKELKECQNHAFIICCDSAFKCLLAAGITPHATVVVDGQDTVTSFFDYERSENTMLIINSLCHPSVHEEWRGPVYWYNSKGSEGAFLSLATIEFTGQIGALNAGGSVTTVMFSVAMLLHPLVFIFMGVDSAYYSKENLHAVNSPAGAFKILSITEREDVYGNRCYTTPVLDLYAYWLESAFVGLQGKKIFVNATEGGVISKGCLVMKFEQAREMFLQREYDIRRIIPTYKRENLPARWKFEDNINDIPKNLTYFPKDYREAIARSVEGT